MNDNEADVVFEPLPPFDERQEERRKSFEAYIAYLQNKMLIESSVPEEFYQSKGDEGEINKVGEYSKV